MNYFRYVNLCGKLPTNNIELKNPKCGLGSGPTPNCLNQVFRPALSLWRCNSTRRNQFGRAQVEK